VFWAFSRLALTVGEVEKFPPRVILRTLLDMPKLKKDFFEKSPWAALFTRVTFPLVAAMMIVIGIVVVLLLK
jgi:hypothetical protein